MTRIRFKAHGANSVIGSFSSGDVANVGDDFAKHLVAIGVAQYLEQPVAPQPDVRGRKRKAAEK